MRTITNTDANRRCNCTGCDLVGQVVIYGSGTDAIACEDTLADAIAAARRLGSDLTQDDLVMDNRRVTSEDILAAEVVPDDHE